MLVQRGFTTLFFEAMQFVCGDKVLLTFDTNFKLTKNV